MARQGAHQRGSGENGGVEVLQRFDQNALTASETVESADFESIPRSEVVEAGEPLRPIGDSAGLAMVNEHSFTTGGTQLSLLRSRRVAPPTAVAGQPTENDRFRWASDRELLINADPGETGREHPS